MKDHLNKVLEEGLGRYEDYIHNQTEFEYKYGNLDMFLDDIWNVSLFYQPSKGKRFFGQYHRKTKEIYVFKKEDSVDTVLHELAHHICNVIHPGKQLYVKSHGPEWKDICLIVGARPRATS